MSSVTFLGVGAALPGPGQTNSSFLVEGEGICLLFDCGPAVLQQLAAVGKTPGDVTHLFVSHGHGDHALGWPMFLLWWALEGRASGRPPPVVLAGRTTWRHLRGLWQHAYRELPDPPYAAVELPDEGAPEQPLTPGVTITAWPMMHSTAFPVLGARVVLGGRALAFTADTARCDAVVAMSRGADLLVHDARHAATVPPRMPDQAKYHCTAQDAGEYAEAAGVKNLALVHIGPEYDGRHPDLVTEARARFSGQVVAPRAGEVFAV